jgi:CTP synthase (UTP-ammonia lyase)
MIALLGDDRGHPSHQELNALVPRMADELGVDAVWVPTASEFDPLDFAGVWLVPGSPYENDNAVYAALSAVRTHGVPFLGTCGGFQYAVIEYLRNVLGVHATHAESDGEDRDNAVSAMACSLYGEQRTVTPQPGSRFISWIGDPFVGMHYCNYAPTEAAITTLRNAGVIVGATAPDTSAEVLEFPDHPFYVASLFQPHIGASRGEPIHPLIRAFVAATAST